MNAYLDKALNGPHLLPEDADERARARIWMLSADSEFYSAVFVAIVGRERGFTEERVSEAREKQKRRSPVTEAFLETGERTWPAAVSR